MRHGHASTKTHVKRLREGVIVGDNHIRAVTFVKLPSFFYICVKTKLYKVYKAYSR